MCKIKCKKHNKTKKVTENIETVSRTKTEDKEKNIYTKLNIKNVRKPKE